MKRNLEIVELLLDQGADVSYRDLVGFRLFSLIFAEWL